MTSANHPRGGLDVTATFHADSVEDWLQPYLLESIRKRVCTTIRCTTCGAQEFRRGLLSAVAAATDRPLVPRLDRDGALVVARALARVQPARDDAWRLEATVRLVLFDIWYAIDEFTADRELEPILVGTWGGEVLARMKAHHAAREAARRRFEESQDPIIVQARREEKRRLRQEKHAERIALNRGLERASGERPGNNAS
jgi:hypothetical protein